MLIDGENADGENKASDVEKVKEKYDFFEGRMHGSSGSREGAVRGLASLSPQAIERGLIESAGAKIIGEEALSDDAGEVLAVMVRPFVDFSWIFSNLPYQDALSKLKPPSKTSIPLGDMEDDVRNHLEEAFGPRFARLISADGAWAKALLNRTSD
jgi:transcription initiation factor TFIID subunit 6